MGDFPFDIMDVVSLLNLRIKRRQPNSIYTDCPICGDKRGKMNVNLEKNVFRCNYCGEYGGMIALYAKTYNIGGSDAYREICGSLPGGPAKADLSWGGHTGNRPSVCEETAVQKMPSSQNSGLAGADEIHKTLSQLLGTLTLSEPHRNNLRNRGLTDNKIEKLGYKSTPRYYQCQSLTERLINQGCTVQGVPGFYLDGDGRWTVKFHTKTAGILIPVRGIDGLIRGAQIRLDVPIKDENEDSDKEGAKYIWLSSSNKHMGVTSGSPVHFVGDPFARTVYVTEGSLKADVAHCLMNRSFAAVAGASNLGQLDPVLSALAHNGTKLIVEAHDMDKYRNEMIGRGASNICAMAQKHNMESRRLTWNPNYKGVDDWQLALKIKKQEDNNSNFKERFIAGLCGMEAMDDCIGEWNSGAGNDQSLRKYLGLTEREYEVCLNTNELEQLLLARRKRQRFRIYQLEFTDGARPKPFAFLGIKALHKAGYDQPPASEYRLVMDSELLHDTALSVKCILNQIRRRYSGDMPGDYRGRAVSPSDVIELYDNEKQQYFYCDPEDFTEVKFSPSLALSMKARS